MIAEVEIEAETIAIQLHGTVEIRHREHDGHEAFNVVSSHKRMMPLRSAVVECRSADMDGAAYVLASRRELHEDARGRVIGASWVLRRS
jgi:hypothetical protein